MKVKSTVTNAAMDKGTSHITHRKKIIDLVKLEPSNDDRIKKKSQDRYKLIAIRHAPLHNSDPNLCYGWSEAELDEAEIPSIAETAVELQKIMDVAPVLISSDSIRAKRTAEVLSTYLVGSKVITDSRLRERNFGNYEGRSIEELKTENPSLFDSTGELSDDAVVPGGESTNQHRNRIVDFLTNFKAEYGVGELPVCLVSHGNSIRHMISFFAGVQFKFLRKHADIEPLSLSELSGLSLTSLKFKSRAASTTTADIFSIGINSIDQSSFELLERKGKGHPDTICDCIAEEISREYSRYCLKNFGVVLRHMVDKIAIQGGRSKVWFGGGEMILPIRLALNGRFTKEYCGESIPYREIASSVIRRVIKDSTIDLDVDKWVNIEENIHFSQGPGVVYQRDGATRNERESFFSVTSDLAATTHGNRGRSNDTSTGVGYSPRSTLENLAIDMETFLNSSATKRSYPWIGTDIKVMAKRVKNVVGLTLCVPLMAQHTPSADCYREALRELRNILMVFAKDRIPKNWDVQVYLNTRDEIGSDDFYMTITGSAIECGDEGAVGRGNRACGVIPFTRRMSMEAPCGKNPVYHIGKVYTAMAQIISHAIYRDTGVECYVYLTSQIGKPMEDPWSASVEMVTDKVSPALRARVNTIVHNHLCILPCVTELVLDQGVTLF